MFLSTAPLIGFALASMAGLGHAFAETLPGPYPALVERVVDGDTIAVRVTVWLQHEVEVLVRLRGIDAPELRGDCDTEKRRAELAALALKRIVAEGPVTLTAIEGDKYFGRIVADVTTVRGHSVAASLVAGGFARAYDGEARASWCDDDAVARIAE